MNYGMIGALGGVGAGLEKQGAFLAEQEKEDKAMARQTSFEDWKMKKRAEYEIAAEGRADQRTQATEQRGEQREERKEVRTDKRGEEQKDRDFTRTQTEAPTRRTIKVEDKKAEKQGEYDVEGANVDTIGKVERAKAEGKETPAEKKLREAQADSQTANAEYTRGAKTALGDASAAAKAAGTGKLDPAVKEELDVVQRAINERRKMIDQGRLDGSWNDDKLTPGQQRIQDDLLAAQKRERTLLGASRTNGASGNKVIDQVGAQVRGGGPTFKNDPAGQANPDRQQQLRTEYQQTQQALATAGNSEQRAGLEEMAAGQRLEAQRLGFDVATPATAPAPAMVRPQPATAVMSAPATKAPAAAPGTPQAALAALTGKTPQDAAGDVEQARAELTFEAGGPKPSIKDKPEAREAYAAKLDALRARLRQAEGTPEYRQYLAERGQQRSQQSGVARVFAQP